MPKEKPEKKPFNIDEDRRNANWILILAANRAAKERAERDNAAKQPKRGQ